jgi:hypothetical protein
MITEAKMAQWTHRGIALLFCMAVCCGCLGAQTAKTVTIRMLNGKTGKLIATSHYLVRINHEQTVHGDWVVQNEDGTGKLTVPSGASVFSIQATYESALYIYFNCDSATGKENPGQHWYGLSEILTSGVVAPNGCRSPKDAAKFKPIAKPGEFVFFVRELSAREQLVED